MTVEELSVVWMDGELVEWRKATVHVLSHALHYGSGVFEGIRCYETPNGPAVFRLSDHLRRLYRSAHVYHIEIPYSPQELTDAVRATIRANGVRECYIRPIVYRGYGEMGLNPLKAPINVAIAVWRWPNYFGGAAAHESGIRVKVSSWRRMGNNMFPPAAKATGQYLNSGLAKMEAVKAGYDEAVMLNAAGYVTDGSGENVFVVRDGALSTPPLSAGCLEGITRDSAIRIARDLGYEVVERELVRTDLYEADEAFLTGTAAELTPIREVDDRTVGSGQRGPITKEIQETFLGAIHGELERYRAWNEPVG